MSRRRQTANIPNPTHSNRQDPQHIIAADIRDEMRHCALTHPKPSHLNWHDLRNLTAECQSNKSKYPKGHEYPLFNSGQSLCHIDRLTRSLAHIYFMRL